MRIPNAKEKLHAIAVTTFLVGFGMTQGGYRMWNPEEGKIYISRDVRFRETQTYGSYYKIARNKSNELLESGQTYMTNQLGFLLLHEMIVWMIWMNG
jgi:hypothetical protein